MKTLIKKYPVAARFTLAILLFSVALIGSGLVNKGLIKQYFPFASTIFLLIATWILYKTDHKSLSNIGLNFQSKNLLFLPLGVLIGALAFLLAKFLRALYTGETIHISTTINYQILLYALYTILPTVAVEEFLFRGYLFKKTIEISSVLKANILFAIAFTLIHVLDEGAINNMGMVVFLIISIPVGHLLFATALLKSKSLFFPIGIHLGNNWATRHLISSHQDGESILYISNQARFDTWLSFITFILLWNLFFLFVTYLIWKWHDFSIAIRRKKE